MYSHSKIILAAALNKVLGDKYWDDGLSGKASVDAARLAGKIRFFMEENHILHPNNINAYEFQKWMSESRSRQATQKEKESMGVHKDAVVIKLT